MSQNNKLFIGNLSYTADEGALADLFSEVGEVLSVKIITDKHTGRSKGFAFVEMADGQLAQTAIERFNNAAFEGRPLSVSEARPQEPRAPFGGGGGEGGHRRFDRGGNPGGGNRRGGNGGGGGGGFRRY